jgi:hypothetical protein
VDECKPLQLGRAIDAANEEAPAVPGAVHFPGAPRAKVTDAAATDAATFAVTAGAYTCPLFGST